MACCKQSVFPNFRTLVFGILVCTLSLSTYGIQEVVLNVPEQLFLNYLNESLNLRFGLDLGDDWLAGIWGGVVAAMSIGAAIGSAFAVCLADIFGRKTCLFGFTNIFVLVGSTCMYLSHQQKFFELLMVGRLLLGFSIGLSTTLTSVYIIECSPQEHRGFMATMFPVCAHGIMILSLCMSMPSILGNQDYWGYLLALQAIPATIQLILFPLFPETPPFLYIKRRDTQKSTKSLTWIRGKISQEQIDATMREYEAEVQMATATITFWRLWNCQALRNAALLAVLAGAMRSFTGIAVLHCYSTQLFLELGITESIARSGSLILGAAIIPVMISGVIVDKLGRKPLLLTGLAAAIGNWLILLLIQWFPTSQFTESISLASILFTFVVVIPAGPGSVSWYIGSELVPEAARAKVAGLTTMTLWISYLLTVFAFPLLCAQIGLLAVFILFILPVSIGFIILAIFLPETKQKSPMEVLEKLAGPEALEDVRRLLSNGSSYYSFEQMK